MIKNLLFVALLTITATHPGLQADSFLTSASLVTPRIVSCYPNPAISFINIDLQKNTAKNYNFVVFNFLGKKVVDIKELNTHSTLDLTNFTRGLYIFQLKDVNGRVIESGKFQVDK
jgi:hypothetical protein